MEDSAEAVGAWVGGEGGQRQFNLDGRPERCGEAQAPSGRFLPPAP